MTSQSPVEPGTEAKVTSVSMGIMLTVKNPKYEYLQLMKDKKGYYIDAPLKANREEHEIRRGPWYLHNLNRAAKWALRIQRTLNRNTRIAAHA